MEGREKRPYEAPKLTTVVFRVERGYADSIGTLALSPYLASVTGGGFGSRSLENRVDNNDAWGSGEWY